MEPPAKRPRLDLHSYYQRPNDDDDDELNFEPEEISRRRDPGYQLQQERAVAADRLKSTFEHIFEKYERDFSEIGDEIDLRTGEIIVNRGHLEAMRNEKDVGDQPEEEEEGMLLSEMLGSESEEEDEDEDEEERILQGRAKKAEAPSQALQVVTRATQSASQRSALPTPVRLASQQRLSHLSHSRYTPVKPSPLSRGAWEIDNEFIEPAWQTPELPRPNFPGLSPSGPINTIYQLPAMDGSKSVWASDDSSMRWPSSTTRRGPSSGAQQRARLADRVTDSPMRRLLPAPSSDDNDDEDEILMGSSQRRSNDNTSRLPSSPSPGPSNSLVPSRNQIRSRSKPMPTKAATQGDDQAVKPAKAKSATVRKASKVAATNQPGRTISSQPKRRESAPLGKPKNRVRSSRSHPLSVPQFSGNIEGDSDGSFEVASPQSPRRKSSNFVIAIPLRKAPDPDSLTIVDDTSPQSVSTIDRLPMQAVELPGETCRGDASEMSVSEVPTEATGAPTSGSPSVVAADEQEQLPAQHETFTRNEIDPSYDFSDEDDAPLRKTNHMPHDPAPGKKSPALLQLESSVGRTECGSVQSQKCDVLDSHVRTDIELDSVIAPVEDDEARDRLVVGSHYKDGGREISDSDGPPALSSSQNDDYMAMDLDEPSASGETGEQTKTTPRRSLRQSLPLSVNKARDPSPPLSDDSLGIALDAIIASQKLFEDSDQDPNSSPSKPVDGSLLHFAQGSSSQKRRRSVRFLDEDVEDHEGRPRIISTPPLRKDKAHPEATSSAAEAQELTQREEQPGNTTAAGEEVDRSVNAPEKEPQASGSGGMFAANRARRGKRASLPPPPEATSPPVNPPPLKSPLVETLPPAKLSPRINSTPKAKHSPVTKSTARKPFIKRRSLLSIALESDDDDEDPLNVMSLLTTWTTANNDSSISPSTPKASRRFQGPSSSSTVRKRIAREGFGGLTTPKKTLSSPVGSPTGSVIHTPGGHIRRCGVDGFRCDRDFCFTCLSG